MNVRCAITVIILSILLISCAGESPIGPSEPGITGTTWKLRSIQQFGTARLEIQNPQRFTALFAEDGRVTVRADCNRCSGQFELTGSALRLGRLACTKAFCGPNSPDAQFLSALEGGTTVSGRGGTLTIASQDTVLVFEH